MNLENDALFAERYNHYKCKFFNNKDSSNNKSNKNKENINDYNILKNTNNNYSSNKELQDLIQKYNSILRKNNLKMKEYELLKCELNNCIEEKEEICNYLIESQSNKSKIKERFNDIKINYKSEKQRFLNEIKLELINKETYEDKIIILNKEIEKYKKILDN